MIGGFVLLALLATSHATVFHFSGSPESTARSYHYHSEPLTNDIAVSNRPFIEFEGWLSMFTVLLISPIQVECNSEPVSWIVIASDISGLSRFQVWL
jgi:hypothetical protein